MNLKGLATMIFFLSLGVSVFSQIISTKELRPDRPIYGYSRQILISDAHVTSVFLWIKDHISEHIHINHSEYILVLKGRGSMFLGIGEPQKSSYFKIKKGDIIYIPQGAFHYITAKSCKLKAVSILAPEFDGKDWKDAVR